MSRDLNTSSLTKEILRLREEYVKDNELSDITSYWDINNGFCVEFAEDIVNSFNHETEDFWIAEAGNFKTGINGEEVKNEIWDKELLERYWNINPPQGLTWDDVDKLALGYHAWIVFNKKHYDAECPKGVDSFFELPLYKNYIEHYIENKKQSA